MLVFATSDKGGTGRSVTSCNILYRLALHGLNVCYLDFDFGSPTAGAIFGIDAISRGTDSKKGLHAYFEGSVVEPESWNIWTSSDRRSLRAGRPASAGRMVLMPGDEGGAEFTVNGALTDRCRQLFLRMEEEFDVAFVDLSAGRSYALQMALAVTAGPQAVAQMARWLIFHRWTRQHVVAAGGLVYGDRGILDSGIKLGHDREELLDQIRFVRTAVIDPNAPDLSGLRSTQLSWLLERNEDLMELAARLGLGRATRLGSVPLDPMLQWHEQLLTNADQYIREVANFATVEAFEELADSLLDERVWERL
jgi:CobQ/CobB/MinD/ParA family nucleotide binding protein